MDDLQAELIELTARAQAGQVDHEQVRRDRVASVRAKTAQAIASDAETILKCAMSMWRENPNSVYCSPKSYPDWHAAEISELLRQKSDLFTITFSGTGHWNICMRL
jgi:CelD/BcsL family acetyltransferase involved in cellulose biosynthesis